MTAFITADLESVGKPMPLKMYILVKETVQVGFAMNSIGHGVLMAEDKWKEDPDYQEWRKNSFKKVTCKVDLGTFNGIKNKYLKDDYVAVVTESALQGEETVLVIKPHPNAKLLKYLPLYK